MNRIKKLILIFSIIFLVFIFGTTLSSCKTPNEPGPSETDPNNNDEIVLSPGDPFYDAPGANQPLFDYSGLNLAQIVFVDQMGTERVVSLALYEDLAPVTCSNFIKLSLSGHYNNTIIHRLVPDFVIQGGGYTVSSIIDEDQQFQILPNPSVESIYGEFSSNGFTLNQTLLHEPGVISMARLASNKDSATDQFFICLKKSTKLDGEYAAFGKCIDSMSLYNITELGKSNFVNVAPGMENCAYPFITVKSIDILDND